MELSDNLLIINYWTNIIPDMWQKKCREIFTMSNQICGVHVCSESEENYMSFNLWFLDIWKRLQGIVWDLFTARIVDLVVSTLNQIKRKHSSPCFPCWLITIISVIGGVWGFLFGIVPLCLPWHKIMAG